MPLQSDSIEQDRPAFSGLANALLLTLAVLWCVYWFLHGWHYWEDDAYIHLEFARSLAAGRGFAFNGTVVSGDTAPLWVLLLAGVHALIPNWIAAGKLLTVLGAAFGLTGAYAFARRLGASLPDARFFPAAMLLLIVANPYFCYWVFSGMEPVAAAGVAFWAVLAATPERPSAKTFLTGCLLAGIAPLMRPEMTFLAGILALLLLVQWVRLPASPAKPGALAAGLLLISAPLAAWSVYSLHAFGHLIPNTNAAKRAGPADSVVRHLLAIHLFAFPVVLCGLLAGIVYLIRCPSAVRDSLWDARASAFGRRSARMPDRSLRIAVEPAAATQGSRNLPLAGWVFVHWASITTLFYIWNHTYVQTRYILVTAPGLTIAVMMLALSTRQRTGRVLYATALVWAVAVSVVMVRPFLRNKGINCQLTQTLALFIRDHIPPVAPVGLYAIGEIAFVSGHPIIDIGGITRPEAIPYLNDPTGAAMLRWARSQGAQYYIADKQPEPGAALVYTANQMFVGWTFRPALYSTSNPVSLWRLAPPAGPLWRSEALPAADGR